MADASVANPRLESYLQKLRTTLRDLPSGEVDDILREIRSHVLDRAEAGGQSIGSRNSLSARSPRRSGIPGQPVRDRTSFLARGSVSLAVAHPAQHFSLGHAEHRRIFCAARIAGGIFHRRESGDCRLREILQSASRRALDGPPGGSWRRLYLDGFGPGKPATGSDRPSRLVVRADRPCGRHGTATLHRSFWSVEPPAVSPFA